MCVGLFGLFFGLVEALGELGRHGASVAVGVELLGDVEWGQTVEAAFEGGELPELCCSVSAGGGGGDATEAHGLVAHEFD